ncbi:hypothetical protein K7X08_007288 [Anisodus acutangulus]|uniref:Glutathione S-transferase n=1 Tax=Anisodus acutangulus TaxID=402998 RepID=A0A9Q1LCE5_9SOLA|nr:hypothetical protein K7X08_007288 [Anisodus acutangulus]
MGGARTVQDIRPPSLDSTSQPQPCSMELPGPQFDYLEKALDKFDDGPFFLGQFSQVDIVYAPFIERFQIFLGEMFKYDITSGRIKLAKWIEEVNKLDGHKQTKVDPKIMVDLYKKKYLA